MDESTYNQCMFSEVLDTFSLEKTYATSELTPARKQTLINASHDRKDSFHETIDANNFIYHTLCYTQYTSKEKIQRHLERKPAAESSENIDTPQKSTKRGDFAPFDFSVHCFICGDIWSVIMDKKHPDRREKKLWYTVQDSRSWKQETNLDGTRG